MTLAPQLVFLSGDLVATRPRATEADARNQSSTLIEMLFWNAVVVVGALVIFL